MAEVDRHLDAERIKDFSTILLGLHKRQDRLELELTKSLELLCEMSKKNQSLSAEVSRLQHLVGLNNVFIALKRDNNGEFEPMAIQTIVQEVIEQTKSMKRTHPSAGD